MGGWRRVAFRERTVAELWRCCCGFSERHTRFYFGGAVCAFEHSTVQGHLLWPHMASAAWQWWSGCGGRLNTPVITKLGLTPQTESKASYR